MNILDARFVYFSSATHTTPEAFRERMRERQRQINDTGAANEWQAMQRRSSPLAGRVSGQRCEGQSTAGRSGPVSPLNDAGQCGPPSACRRKAGPASLINGSGRAQEKTCES